MNPLATATPTAASRQPLPIPVAVLDALAGRFRAGGLFLLAFDPDSKLCWHDSQADDFFQRYALAVLQAPRTPGPSVGPIIEHYSAGARVSLPTIPGVSIHVVHLPGKRSAVASLVVASRNSSFQLREEILRWCSRLSLDGQWLLSRARELPIHSPAALQFQANLVLECLQDQLQLAGLERQLNSVSEQLTGTYEELSLIYQVSGGMRVNRGAADFFKQTCADVLAVMDLRGIGVVLHAQAARLSDPVLFGQLTLPGDVVNRLGAELIRILQHRKTALLINDLSVDRQLYWLKDHARRLLAVPLQRQEQTLGCLFALDKIDGEFDSTDAKLLNSIANECAIYLENATLFDDVHGLMMGLLHSLTSAVDAKDPYTCGHSERVALLSRHLAQQIGLPEQEIDEIYMAGLLHDVGKIGVPESVLHKTGKLTDDEYLQMQKHPEIGAKILQDVRQIRKVIPGVLFHHERFDGKGYPARLSGTDIPLMGRIICLADCFDAMTSNRTYRMARPFEVALTEIRRCAGTHFDPELAETFLKTSADRYRELLQDHQQKSKRLLAPQESPTAARRLSA